MDKYEREIIELHQFFVDWFKGDLPKNESGFARFSVVTSPDFAIITPDGRRYTYEQITSSIYDSHANRAMMRITIKAVNHHATHGDIHIVEYEEWQDTDPNQPTARLSTVIFKDDVSTPNGLRWLHVHETWKEGHAPA